MATSQIRSKFGGDFLVPSFYGNIKAIPRKSHSINLSRVSKKENRESSVETITARRCNTQRKREKPALKERNIGDSGFVSSLNTYRQCSRSSRTLAHYDEQEDQMVTARNTSDFNMETVREKALHFEFDHMPDQYGDYLANQILSQNIEQDEANYSDSSNITLKRKYTEIFQHSSRPSAPIYNKQLDSGKKASKNNNKSSSESNNEDMKLILKALKRVFETTPSVDSRDPSETEKLYGIVKKLQDEQETFRNLINSQQHQLNNIQSKYFKAENTIKSQKYEIQKLNRANTQLEHELNSNIYILKAQLQEKANEVAHFPQTIKNEKLKTEKLSKQNCELIKRLQEVKNELTLTRSKLVEAAQKRGTVLNKLKASENDLKIFRNQNNILKAEKRTLVEELKKLKTYNEELTKRTSKNMSRQKERGESQQRFLQKKVLDLELELTRSRNSTHDLIEERDKLIAELHQQLNNLVHNLEVSQKHIRVLRKHIHSMSQNSAIPQQCR